MRIATNRIFGRSIAAVILTMIAGAGFYSLSADNALAQHSMKPTHAAKTTQTVERDEKAAHMPKVIAIKFHADYCGACKKIGRVMPDVIKESGEQPVLFLKMDITNDATAAQAEYHMAALGLTDYWEKYGQRTGYVLLINAQTHELIGKITSKDNAEAMAEKINRAVNEV